MNISFLIATKDREETVNKAVASVLKHLGPDDEVVVLDDGSEEVVRLHEESDPRIHLFRSPKPSGVSGARNKLGAKATKDLMFFMDDDAELDPDFSLKLMRDLFINNSEVALVATKIVDHFKGGKRLLVPFSQRSRKNFVRLEEAGGLVSYFLGGAHCVRRSVFEKEGGFCGDLNYGEEELDLSYRLLNRDYGIYYCPELVVHHYPSDSVLVGGVPKEIYCHVSNRFFLAKKFIPLIFVLPYLAIWMFRYFKMALERNALGKYFGGLWSGIRLFFTVKREGLTNRAIKYLKVHHGRIGY